MRSSITRLSRLTAAICLLACTLQGARGDVFVLATGGRVRGVLVNKEQKPRTSYIVDTPSGGRVALERAQVKQVIKQSAAEMEYDKIRFDYPDAPLDQWRLAEWCREHRLNSRRKEHLERVIALAPDHEQARKALGYVRHNDAWKTPDQIKMEQGYIRYEGAWRTRQEIAILEEQQEASLAEKTWQTKIARWRKSLADGEQVDKLRERLRETKDPAAAKALAGWLSEEEAPEWRLALIETLGRLADGAGMDVLVELAIHDEDDEMRLAAIDQIAAAGYQPAVEQFIHLLGDKENAAVNRAAFALGRLKDPAAIGPLIDALVTTHKFVVSKGSPEQMSATFSSGPGGGFGNGGFSFGGGGNETVRRELNNSEALDALVILSGGANFNYDQRAWKRWHASSQRKSGKLDARRD